MMHPHPGGADESKIVFPCVMFDGLYITIGYKQSWNDQQDIEEGLFKYYSPKSNSGLIN